MIRNLLLFLCLLASYFLTSQERPPIEIFTSEDYGAQNQNWAISQLPNNNIYVGNNAGLLEYDGSQWRLFQVPNRTPIRSLQVIDDRLFSGSFMDFGYWSKTATGELEYTSISSSMKLELLEDEEFWGIEEIDGWVLFQSLNRVYAIDLINSEFKIIESDREITKMVKFDQKIYLHKAGLGIFRIENERVSLVRDDNVFKENRLTDVISFQGVLHYVTDNAGVYKEVDGELFPSELNSGLNLSGISIYSIISLDNGGIALGTISNGVFLIDKDGSLNYKLDGYDALSNNTVLSLYEDSQQNIWLGLDNGINYINTASRFRIYRDDEGSLGTVYTSIIHNGLLYVGTNQGLFSKSWGQEDSFELIPGTRGQVWKLKVIDGTLFCGHNTGTFTIANDQAINWISKNSGTWDFMKLPGSSYYILQGNYNGLSILENRKGGWTFRNKLKGFEISSRFFEVVDGQIMVNHEFKGLYSLVTDETLSEVKSFSQVPVEVGIGTNILKFSDKLIYSTTGGVYEQLESLKFVKDSTFTQLISPYEELTTLMRVDGSDDHYWCFADDNILFLEPGDLNGSPIVEIVPISARMRNVVTGFGNIAQLEDNKFLIGTSYGYLIFDRSIATSNAIADIKLSGVRSNVLDQEPAYLQLDSSPKLENNNNNIEFSYGIPSYQSTIKTEYSYHLEGYNERWSDWSPKSIQLFENLPPGDYNFKVKGRIGTRETENIAVFSFNIAQPWYWSSGMKFFYFAILVVLMVIMNRLYHNYYRKQQNLLIEQNKRELEMKELQNKENLMRFKNETLEESIKSKNRELAISTMSLIKKNEFLNSIKNELRKTNNDQDIGRVIKIIDRNLNNTDDWKFFEEAFNNADKDFLKKIKTKHPSLTANDLRLCAYLRLNLSSKEIAPLLNISARSVEVKRYRLRKKMNLPHEINLTNYILDL